MGLAASLSPAQLGDVLLDAVGARAGERVALVADADRAAEAEAAADAAARRGLSPDVVVTVEDYGSEDEMPRRAVEAMDGADAALLFVSYDRIQFGGHAAFRMRATARGARVGFVIRHVSSVDAEALRAVAERTRRLADALGDADRVVVTGAGGTHLKASLEGRPALALTNDLSAPGAWGALPDYFEATVAPVEGTAEGVLVVDGTSIVSGVVDEPIRIEVREGLLVAFEGGRAGDELRAFLERAGENATNLGELGIGTNELARPELTGTFADKKIGGTVHFGIGDNRTFGGRTEAAVHVDVQVMDARVELDGRLAVDGPRILV